MHASRVFAVCLGLTGNRSEAEDLLQDTFVRAWERLSTFRGEAAFATWLHRIAVNLSREQARARRRRLLRVASESDQLVSPSEIRSALEGVAAALPDVGLRLDLEQAMARLPDGARAVFVLHDLAGLQHQEIGAQLGIAEGTSKAHLFRARRLLRAMLD